MWRGWFCHEDPLRRVCVARVPHLHSITRLVTRGFTGNSGCVHRAECKGGASDVSQQMQQEQQILLDGEMDRVEHLTSTSTSAPFPTVSDSHERHRSSMGDLLRAVTSRRDSVKGVKNAPPTTRGIKGMAEVFVSASKRKSAESSRRPVVKEIPEGVSLTLVDKLWENVLRKRLDWQRMAIQHPLLLHLPVWWQRSVWSARLLPSSALPLTQLQLQQVPCNGSGSVMDMFVCNAPTGSGKSSLMPLFLLETHWRRLLQRMAATHGTPKDVCVDEPPPSSPPPLVFPTACSSYEYAAAFGASSRVCIVVSQPTRLACMELAKFTASLMASSSSSMEAVHVGGRVGYAVGGDACFSAESEIVFATPGYIVNALHRHGGTLSPTTLVIDEVHCRDVETDLLLAWARRQLHDEMQEGHLPLRQLVLMSATLPVEQMSALLTEQACVAGGASVYSEVAVVREAPKGSERCNPHVLRVDGNMAQQRQQINDSANSTSNTSTPVSQFRVEEYFIDDLPELLETSHVLQPDVARRSASSSASVGVPLLSGPARRVMASLVHFFSYTRFGADIYSSQARVLAQFLLFVLQNLALVPRKPTSFGCQQHEDVGREQLLLQQQQHHHHHHHPESILVFLPGFSEISLVLQSLELLCRTTSAKGGARTSTQSGTNSNSRDTISGGADGGGVVFLQYEHWCFSVAMLHATAIGSPQRQLSESARPFPHRIILSTPVAESSVTIPNVRCVIDSCLERRFFADPLTGVMLRSTAVASASSLQQRRGRTGRTCDGVVFHLAPRRLFVRQLENTDVAPQGGGAQMPQSSALPFTRHGLSVFLAPSQTQPETVTVSAAAVLLRVKHLFPSQPSVLLQHMPSVPPLPAIARGVQQLVDLGLLQSPATCSDAAAAAVAVVAKEEEEENDDAHAVMRRYDMARLSEKGEFVAYMPIPHEQALLIYHALQFACVEEAILIACAMTVPTLLMFPRMKALSDDDTHADTPAVQYLQSLEAQRALAAADTGSGSGNGTYHLSEPMMLRSLLRDWYACTTGNDAVEFFSKYRVNRSALRLVDSSVAQCASRLWYLIAPGGVGWREKDKPLEEELHGEHDTAVLRPSTRVVEQLIVGALPPAYRALLANSLSRLRRCASEHAAHRFSQYSGTMTQWYPQDDQLMRQLQPGPEKKGGVDTRQEPQWKWPSGPPLLLLGPPQHRLCAAFVAAFARNTMRGEDASPRVHHRRLVRNLGALQEATDHTCTFNIKLQAHRHHHHHRSCPSQAAFYQQMTPMALRGVLAPYLSGTQLRQLELFSSGRSAVAHFGDGEDKKGENAEKEEHDTAQQQQQQQQREKLLLAPKVLPFESTSGGRSSAIALAHIGISLLVSIQSALTRLSVLLIPSSSSSSSSSSSPLPLPSSLNNSSGKTTISGPENHGTGGAKGSRVPKVTTLEHAGTRKCSLSFSAVEGVEGNVRDMRVTWYDSYGQERFLLRSDLRIMGYEELFPTPFEVRPHHTMMSAAEEAVGGGGAEAESMAVRVSETPAPALGDDDGAEEGGEHLLLSVQRVAFTRAVHWKVTLPTFREGQQQQQQRGSSSSSTGEMAMGRGRCYYCWSCHSAWIRESAFRAHCRSIAHLNRLFASVKLRMRRDWVAAASSGTLSDLLLRRTSGGVGVALHPCAVSSTSFLNALQWFPRGDAASATLPIAIAGSLVTNSTSEASLTRSTGGGSMLQALHVWVLDVDQMAAKATATVPPLSLFILAGYLASSSAGFEVALLMNEDHSLAYAVMLYDWGIWPLPTPLPRALLRSVLDVFMGKPWRGVPADSMNRNSSPDRDVDEDDVCGPKTEAGGLHWCVISDVCPQCTYCGSSGCGREMAAQDGQCYVAAQPSVDEVVESTILLVLHEYQNSQRTVISFADYTQRVVAKLNMWSAAQQQQLSNVASHPSPRTAPKRAAAAIAMECCSGAELLARLVARRQNQPLESLLRDIGCQFLTPPAAFLAVAEEEERQQQQEEEEEERSSSSSATSARAGPFSASSLVVEGATNEKLFLLPAMLPSYLPAPEFSALLRRHRHAVRSASIANDGTPSSAEEEKKRITVAASLLPQSQQIYPKQGHPSF